MEHYDVFSALSNPVRRRILDILKSGEYPAGKFVETFSDLPQPAISRHLKVLYKAGLVSVRKRSQLRIYALRVDRLREMDVWISHYRKFWTEQFDSLEAHLDSMQKSKKIK